MDTTGPLLTLTTNEDPLVLTKVAQIVTMDVRGREHVQFRGKDQEPVPVRGTSPVILHGDMTREDYDKFETLILTTPWPGMTADINKTRDGHFRAQIKTQGERP